MARTLPDGKKQPNGWQFKIESSMLLGNFVIKHEHRADEPMVCSCGRSGFSFDGPWQHSRTDAAGNVPVSGGDFSSKLSCSKNRTFTPAQPRAKIPLSSDSGWAKPRDERFAHSLKIGGLIARSQSGGCFFIGEHDFTAFSANRRAVEQNMLESLES